MGRIKFVFNKLTLIERQIHLKYGEKISLGVWAFIKYHIYINEIGESTDLSIRANYLSINFLIKIFFINILYVKNFFLKDCWVFSSGRYANDGKDKYMDGYSEEALIFNYTPSKPAFGNLYLHHVKILFYFMANIRFYLCGQSVFYKELSELVKEHNIDFNIDFQKKLLNIKIYEYKLWYRFWKLLFLIKRPKEIYFTSNNFFLPLISASDDFGIRTYEIAHALIHKYHPSYSYGLKSRKYVLPHFYIENNFSHNSNVMFPKDLFFYPVKKYIKQKKLLPEVCILIDQPGCDIEHLIEIGEELKFKCSLQIILIIHPLSDKTLFSKYKSSLEVINLWELSLHTEHKNIVIGYSSNLIIELYYNGFYCISIDPKYYDVFSSREENILLTNELNKMVSQINKLTSVKLNVI